MKAVIAVVVAAVALVVVTSAPAATPLEGRVTTLQRQVTALQRQVRTLQRQMREARNDAVAGQVLGFCVAAITADAFQTTWTAINQAEGRTIFPAPQTINDRGICSSIRVPRQPTLVPPTISPFSALFALLGGSAVAPASVTPEPGWWR